MVFFRLQLAWISIVGLHTLIVYYCCVLSCLSVIRAFVIPFWFCDQKKYISTYLVVFSLALAHSWWQFAISDFTDWQWRERKKNTHNKNSRWRTHFLFVSGYTLRLMLKRYCFLFVSFHSACCTSCSFPVICIGMCIDLRVVILN